MPSDDDKASRNPEMPPIRTDAGAQAWEAFGAHPEQAVLMLPGDGKLWMPARSAETPAIDSDYAEVLEGLGGRTRATVVLTGHSVSPLRDAGLLPAGIHVMGRSGWEHFHNGEHTVCAPVPAELASFDRRLAEMLSSFGLADIVDVERKHGFRAVHIDRDPRREHRSTVLRNIEWLATADGLPFLHHQGIVEVGMRASHLNTLKEFAPNQWSMPTGLFYVGERALDLEVFGHLDWLRDIMGAHVVKVCASYDPALRRRADMIVDSPGELLEVLRELHGS